MTVNPAVGINVTTTQQSRLIKAEITSHKVHVVSWADADSHTGARTVNFTTADVISM